MFVILLVPALRGVFGIVELPVENILEVVLLVLTEVLLVLQEVKMLSFIQILFLGI